MLNRSLAPASSEIEDIELIQAKKQQLTNGVPVYTIHAGSQDLVKIEIFLNAGSIFDSKPMMARAANSLLKEGTTRLTSGEIAEKFDFYGAFLETDCSKDSASVTLYSLNKHLSHVLPVFADIIHDAVFPQHEFEVFIQNAQQHYLVNNQKVDVLARNYFAEFLFGNNNYGYRIKEEDYALLKRDHVQKFYSSHYLENTPTLLLSGFVTDAALQQVETLFGNISYKECCVQPAIIPATIGQQKNHIEKADAVQTAIRIGRLLFNKTHPDYFGMIVLNSLLGGYFGSRLMSNIREDKGYTYGIGSGIVSMKQAGYFVISTEVGTDVAEKALHEIYYEIKRLRDEAVGTEELDLVKNYLLGTFIRSADGPFELENKFKGIYEYGLGYDYYDRYIHTIRSITPQRLQELANLYLREDDLIEVTVGKKG
jgi:zinc protease